MPHPHTTSCPRGLVQRYGAREVQLLLRPGVLLSWDWLLRRSDDARAVKCLPCEAKKMKTSQEEVEKIRCNACATFLPLYNFIERQLMG